MNGKMGIDKGLIIERKAYELLPEICEKYDLKNIGIFSGDSFSYEIVKNRLSLEDLSNRLVFKDPVKISKASLSYVNRVRGKIRSGKIKIALVVGGGTPCDVVKLSSYQEGIEFIYFPTTLSHDGINSNRASIKGKYPYSKKAKSPLLVFIDLETIEKSPLRNIRAGFGDGLAKCVSLSDWKLDYEINKEKCELKFNPKVEKEVVNCFMDLFDTAKYCIQRKTLLNDEEVLKKLAFDLYKFGECMQQVDSSRPCSGSEHLFSHALDILAPKPALHGEQVAVGTIACLAIYNEELNIKPYGINWEEMRDVLQGIGLPVNSNELGINSMYLINSLGRNARRIERRRGRFTVLDFININRRKAKKYLEIANII